MTISSEAPVASAFHVLATEIVAAYVSSNTIAADQVPGLIAHVYKTLVSLDADQAPDTDRVPAVPVKNSGHPDSLVSLEYRQKLHMTQRHPLSAHDPTPTT